MTQPTVEGPKGGAQPEDVVVMPIEANPLPAERVRHVQPPRPQTVPATGGIRVLQNRQAPAQRSLFQQALPAR